MTRSYLAIFEKGDECWSAFAPDVSGTGGMGDTVDDARRSLLEGIGYMFEDALERGLPIPDAAAMSIDFSEFDPNRTTSQYVVEWLPVEVPSSVSKQPAHGLVGVA